MHDETAIKSLHFLCFALRILYRIHNALFLNTRSGYLDKEDEAHSMLQNQTRSL